jgi:hypothetical protein
MKRIVMLVSMVLVLVLLLAASPVFATDSGSEPKEIDTSAEIIGDGPGGSPPIIKGKWEKFHHPNGTVPPSPVPPSNWLYDDDPIAPGIQVFPPGEADPQGKVNVQYWAVVTDPQGTDDIQFVSVDVYHPDGSPKYQVMLLQEFCNYLYPVVRQAAIDEMTAADEAGAIRYGDTPTGGMYNLDDLIHQYEKGEAKIYKGIEILSYHQMHGTYRVVVCAADQNLEKDYLENTFTYVKAVGFMLDFNALNFGQIKICKEVIISGDKDMTTPEEPTVKNLGNSPCRLWVRFDDMGFGKRTEGGVEVWNVHYDARLDLFNPVYFDPCGTDVFDPACTDTLIPGILDLCQYEQLSFSIHVEKAEPGMYMGKAIITATQ